METIFFTYSNLQQYLGTGAYVYDFRLCCPLRIRDGDGDVLVLLFVSSTVFSIWSKKRLKWPEHWVQLVRSLFPRPEQKYNSAYSTDASENTTF